MLPSRYLISVLFCFFGLLAIISCIDESGPIFKTNLGSLKGSVLTSDDGVEFFAFRGIPFAKPPVKELRFKPPQSIEKWDGILDATEDGNMCIQFHYFRNMYGGDEDCLFLNVYTPKIESQNGDELLAVMFFIHGGGFFFGTGASTMYGPQRLIDKQVILVTINYRLGPFGFLSTMDKHAPGNFGFLDQVMALQWVQDNIAAFGGDPTRVTIFGDSAGGASVIFHILSPLSKGLFHAAIPQSGSALNKWAVPRPKEITVNSVKILSKRLNCPTSSNKVMVDCLKRRAALDITATSAAIVRENLKAGDGAMEFMPVIDEGTYGGNAFLPDFAERLFDNNEFNPVPVMSGVTKDEGFLFFSIWSKSLLDGRELDKEKFFDFLYGSGMIPTVFIKTAEKGRQVLKNIFDKYFQHVDESDAIQKISAAIDILSDITMNYGIDVTNEILAAHNNPTYVYKFAYRGEHTMMDKMVHDPNYPVKELNMVSHIDELQYLFRCDYFLTSDLSAEDKVMADILLTLWTNFAKTKMPSLKGSRYDYAGFEWEPLHSNNYHYMNLSVKSSMVNRHLSSHYESWRDAVESFNAKDEL